MKPLFTEQELNNTKTIDRLPCTCYICGDTFHPQKRAIMYVVRGTRPLQCRYCSKTCKGVSERKTTLLDCTNCQTPFHKMTKEVLKSKSGNHFCSRPCSATYNNKHKKHGTRRSKLEVWLETQLTTLYPNIPMDFNQSDAIGSELDIYIPSLNLAVELNGIFHYEPIYGKDKLGKLQENDISKSKACIDNHIDLCIIDTSSQKYFKPKTSQKYLDIITNIFKERSSTS